MEGGKTVSKAAYKIAKTNKIKRSRADLIFDIILYTIGIILILITLYPMYFIVIASISDPQLVSNGEIMFMSFDTTNAGLTDTLAGKITCDVECNPLHGPRAEELIKALEAGEEVQKLNYVDEEIFAADDTVDKVTAVNSLDEEGEYAVTPITQEIIDGRAY